MKPREIAALRQRGSKGYKAPTREKAVFTTGTLAAGAQIQGTIPLAVSYRLMALDVTGHCRVRLYDKATSQSADAGRAIGTDPLDGAGVIFEFVADNTGLYSVSLSPLVPGSSMASPPTNLIPITVTNIGTGSASLTVTLTYLKEE